MRSKYTSCTQYFTLKRKLEHLEHGDIDLIIFITIMFIKQ